MVRRSTKNLKSLTLLLQLSLLTTTTAAPPRSPLPDIPQKHIPPLQSLEVTGDDSLSSHELTSPPADGTLDPSLSLTNEKHKENDPPPPPPPPPVPSPQGQPRVAPNQNPKSNMVGSSGSVGANAQPSVNTTAQKSVTPASAPGNVTQPAGKSGNATGVVGSPKGVAAGEITPPEEKPAKGMVTGGVESGGSAPVRETMPSVEKPAPSDVKAGGGTDSAAAGEPKPVEGVRQLGNLTSSPQQNITNKEPHDIQPHLQKPSTSTNGPEKVPIPPLKDITTSTTSTTTTTTTPTPIVRDDGEDLMVNGDGDDDVDSYIGGDGGPGLEYTKNSDGRETALNPPPQEGGQFRDDEGSHFFAYFLTVMVTAIIFYLVFHNKQRIIALIIEGRAPSTRRRRRSTNSRVRYTRLDNTLEEAITATRTDKDTHRAL